MKNKWISRKITEEQANQPTHNLQFKTMQIKLNFMEPKTKKPNLVITFSFFLWVEMLWIVLPMT